MQIYDPNPKVPLGYFLQTQWVWFQESLNQQVRTGEGWNVNWFARHNAPLNYHVPCSGVRYLKFELGLLVLITRSEKKNK